MLVAPSTAQDPEQRLLRASLAGLASEPCGYSLRGTGDRCPGPLPVSANARLVEWLSYSRTMPGCALVVCHAGHGTMVRRSPRGARSSPSPLGDMGENAARADWAGVGVRLPWRLLTPADPAARRAPRAEPTGLWPCGA